MTNFKIKIETDRCVLINIDWRTLSVTFLSAREYIKKFKQLLILFILMRRT